MAGLRRQLRLVELERDTLPKQYKLEWEVYWGRDQSRGDSRGCLCLGRSTNRGPDRRESGPAANNERRHNTESRYPPIRLADEEHSSPEDISCLTDTELLTFWL